MHSINIFTNHNQHYSVHASSLIYYIMNVPTRMCMVCVGTFMYRKGKNGRKIMSAVVS